MSSSFTLCGLVAAPFTPFNSDRSLNLAVIPRYAKILADQGVRGAFVNGTTGEGASLTNTERKAVAEAWRRAAPSSLALIMHVGHTSIAESIELARHAAEIGCDAIAAIAPSFFKPAGAAGLAEVCAQIAGAAPGTPFYYYHIPSMTGFNCSVADFLERVDHIPNFAGVKFTHEDLLDFGLSRQARSGRYDILHGRDETLLCGLSLGATGAVGSTYNFMAKLYHDVISAFERGDLKSAWAAQAKVQRIIAVLVRYGGGVIGGKSIMKMCGLDCGPVRLPLTPLTVDASASFERELRDIGFFEFAAHA